MRKLQAMMGTEQPHGVKSANQHMRLLCPELRQAISRLKGDSFCFVVPHFQLPCQMTPALWLDDLILGAVRVEFTCNTRPGQREHESWLRKQSTERCGIELMTAIRTPAACAARVHSRLQTTQ